MSPTMSGLSTIGTLLSCRWSAHRLQRYLDADPSGQLTAAEVDRLEAHLARCARCSTLAEEYRVLRGAFGRWATASPPDPAAVQRLRTLVDTLGTRDAT
ncbi:MAG: zf-HC2 domain-containing protein [Ornithinimicrobium sp.]